MGRMTSATKHYEKLAKCIDTLMASYAKGPSIADFHSLSRSRFVTAFNYQYQSPRALLQQIRTHIRAKRDELYAVEMRVERNKE